MRILLNFTFKNSRGEQVTDWVYLNRDCDEQWVSYSAWIGSQPSGDTENVNPLAGPSAIYMKEGNSVIALVRGIASKDIMINIGDIGTGKLYAGGVRYPSPIDFTWECIPTDSRDIKPQSATPASPDDAVYIRPFVRP